jgi:3-phenylpropionate/trans-cinnamate dioxygenase ferredoxin reductase subunit
LGRTPVLDGVVIVGAGHAGGSVAALLRQYGYAGEVTLIGSEAVTPYQRPPLSKAYLKGEADLEALKLRPDAFYEEHGIRLMLGTRVSSIDRDRKQVTIEGGPSVGYDQLVLATGSHARWLSLPGAGLPGLRAMRTLADADALRGILRPGRRLAIIGGGYIGLEAAAVARTLGADVILLEREERCLARVASLPLSGFFESYHRARGVEIQASANLTAFVARNDGVLSAVALEDGREFNCDGALVGVGAVATDAIAQEAGLVCANGVVVDQAARSSDPAIFAIGDVSVRPLSHYGNRLMRLESVANALEQSKQVAAAIVGRPMPAPEVPWFWSDQYDCKLQIAGLPFDCDDVIVRGDATKPGFSVFHFQGRDLRAVEAVNAPGEFLLGRIAIGKGQILSKEKVADTAIPIKQVLE